MEAMLKGTAEELASSGMLNAVIASFNGKRLAVHIYEDEEMDETEFLLRDPINKARLLASIEQVRRGEGIHEFTLDEIRQKFGLTE